jgi:hypothetical protein
VQKILLREISMKMRSNSFLVRLSFPLLIAAFCQISVIAGEKVPAELKRFETAPWQVESYKYGDLSGNKTKDAAIILAIYPRGVLGIATDRKLIITTRKADGKLERENKATQTLPLSGERSGGNPTVEIQENTILISQFAGSSTKGKHIYKYKKVNGEWRLIGFTSSCWDSMVNAHPSTNTDVNFLDGHVQAWSERSGKTIEKQDFYKILSFRGKPSGNQNWAVPKLVLRSGTPSKHDVDSGNSAKNISACIQSKYDKNDLYILVSVSGNGGRTQQKIELLDLAQIPIRPSSRIHSLTKDGYKEILRFNLASRDFKRGSGRIGQITNESQFFPFTLVITDKGVKAGQIISTAISAQGAKKYGGLLLLPMTQAPGLSTVNLRNGSIHPNTIALPLYY